MNWRIKSEIFAFSEVWAGKLRGNLSDMLHWKTSLIFKNTSSTSFLFDMPVNEFACGNFLLNNDFRKTIKAKQYPKAQVKVSRLRRDKNNYICGVSLEIAGQKLAYRDFELTKEDKILLGTLLLR